jgi:flavin-binding protein dodecin
MEIVMSHIYPVTGTSGSLPHSIEDAIPQAVASAPQTIRHLEWFQVIEALGCFESDGSIGHFPVGVKLGFRLEWPSGV